MKPPRYLVTGLGKTGLSIANYLHRRNQPFAVYDTRVSPPGLDTFKSQFPDVPIYLQEFPVSLLDEIESIISSPGFNLDKLITNAPAFEKPIVGDIECFAKEVNVPVIAITGTNGKSTVTTLVGEMAKAAGRLVAVAGNIGTPVLDLLDNGVPYDLWVLELSSFQLDLIQSLRPLAATVLNITPDHLDRHHHFEDYVHSKQRIYQHVDCVVYNREDALTSPLLPMNTLADNTTVATSSFGLNSPLSGDWGLKSQGEALYLAHGEHLLLPVTELRIKGQHNWMNALAASALAFAAGIPYAIMRDVLRQFGGLPHRSQWVRTINGVDWINDSKGTNIGATASAIAGIGSGIQGKIVLIAGGQGKGADFNSLREALKDFVRTVILIGEDADQIEEALGGMMPVTRATSLEDAVLIAKQQANPGDVVLLSPACASFDMFRDFNHRGEQFAAAVSAL